MLGPYARGVEVTVAAPDGCALSSLQHSLAEPGQTRRAKVSIQISTCTGSTNTSTSTQTATWTEQVFDHYEPVSVPEQHCEAVCGSVLTGGETCTTNYQTNPPSLLCTKNTQTSCYDKCETVTVVKQEPRYRPEERKAPRTVTTETASIQITGSWSVTRDGKEQSGTINHTESNAYATAPATGGADRYVNGTPRTPEQLASVATDFTHSTIRSAIDQLFAEDVARATAAARTASTAGRIDDEEDAWVQAVVLGGTDLGPLATRYDLDRARVVALFGAQKDVAPAPAELPAVATFPSLPRGETNLITKHDLASLEAALPTFGGGRYWIQVDGAFRSLPIVTNSAGQEIAGDSAFLVGVTGATRGLARQATRWGFQLADEAAMSIGLGGRTGGATVIDNSLSSFAATFSMHYALGAGYRKPGKGAVFGGIRGQYEAFLLGTSSGSYASLPLFVRAELPLVYGTVSIEGTGASLAGGSHWGLAVHAVNRRRFQDMRMKYVQLRIESTTVDATSTDFGDTTSMNGDRMLQGVDLTSVHLMYGVGW
jgi:hypothetical protein